ncbi:MAG: hypothetical protein M1837_003569 [Sclerophora amabilis]|nr:MAG: hypothetical protein M1837_003569 [Sclerophora amabilis]
MSTETKAIEPTAKEAFFMLHVLNNQDGNPKINWNAVAQAVGLKNGSVASVRFGQIKKRLGWTGGKGPAPASSGSGGGGGGAKSIPNTFKVTKRAPAKTNGAGKAARGRGRPLTAAELAADHDVDDDAVETDQRPVTKVDEDASFFQTLDQIKPEDAEKYGGALGQMKAEIDHESDGHEGFVSEQEC